MLITLNINKKIRIEVNILDYIIRKVLLIKYKDKQQRLVIYLSKFLNETKRNYEIHDKKILVVIRELEN